MNICFSGSIDEHSQHQVAIDSGSVFEAVFHDLDVILARCGVQDFRNRRRERWIRCYRVRKAYLHGIQVAGDAGVVELMAHTGLELGMHNLC